jgi:hypothetical protein
MKKGPETVRAKYKMASVGSSRNGCATIGTSQLAQRDVSRDFACLPDIGTGMPQIRK